MRKACQEVLFIALVIWFDCSMNSDWVIIKTARDDHTSIKCETWELSSQELRALPDTLSKIYVFTDEESWQFTYNLSVPVNLNRLKVPGRMLLLQRYCTICCNLCY